MRGADIVVIGASWGGLEAMQALLGHLPTDLATPMVLAQHRTADNDSRLAELLQGRTSLRVRDAQDRQPLEDGCLYIAPPDYHLLVESEGLSLSTEAPVSFARPSIDVLFESAAYAYEHRTIGVVLTGASDDGARGGAEIVRHGGTLVVQDPSSAANPIAPRAAIARTRTPHVMPLPVIAEFLSKRCRRSPRPGSANESPKEQ